MVDLFSRLLLDTKGFDRSITKAKKKVGLFASVSKGMFAGLTKFAGYAAAFTGITTSVHAAVTANMEFEKSLSTLRSLTGVTAEELNYFRAEAIRMGMDGTQSAVQMVEAFKLIGGQMPELLKNKTALTQTAEAAVVLADAAGLDVPTAAKALTGALNQMGQSSAHASEYINILAAASQEGSAEIPYLNQAIEKAGGTATAVGIKFGDLVASIEAIAPRITEASSAGINLRNIFLTLESSADARLKPSVVGLSKALENLASRNLDATELTKMFGKESVTAAIALLQERDAFESLRKNIVGTNAAYEQAGINNDNLAGSITKLQNAWTSFINTMAGSNGVLQAVVDNLRNAVNWVAKMNMSDEERTKFEAQDEVKAYQEKMSQRVQNGESPEQAYRKTMEDLMRHYQLSGRADEYRIQAESKREAMKDKVFIWELGERKKLSEEAKQAEKLAEQADKEAKTRKVIEDSLNTQLKILQSASKVQENLNKNVEEPSKPDIDPTKPRKGSAAYLDNEITAKRKELSLAVSGDDRLRISRELDELVRQRRYMDIEVKYRTDFIADTRQISEMADMRKRFEEMKQLPDFSKDKLKPLDLKPQIKEAEDYAGKLNTVTSAIQSMGGAFNMESDNMFQYFANIINGAAQAATAIQALIPVKKAEANANMEAAATAAAGSVAGIPFVGAAMAVAAVASLVAAMASIPKFAEGGIVGGSSFFGDKLLARVNSGEMILNRDQQRNLYALTEDNRAASVHIGFDKVRGADIYLSLTNYMKKTGKKL